MHGWNSASIITGIVDEFWSHSDWFQFLFQLTKIGGVDWIEDGSMNLEKEAWGQQLVQLVLSRVFKNLEESVASVDGQLLHL